MPEHIIYERFLQGICRDICRNPSLILAVLAERTMNRSARKGSELPLVIFTEDFGVGTIGCAQLEAACGISYHGSNLAIVDMFSTGNSAAQRVQGGSWQFSGEFALK